MLRSTNGGEDKKENRSDFFLKKHVDDAQNCQTFVAFFFFRLLNLQRRKETVPALLAHCLQGF